MEHIHSVWSLPETNGNPNIRLHVNAARTTRCQMQRWSLFSPMKTTQPVHKPKMFSSSQVYFRKVFEMLHPLQERKK